MLFRKTLSCIDCGNVFEPKAHGHFNRCQLHREPVLKAHLRKEAILAWAEGHLDAVEALQRAEVEQLAKSAQERADAAYRASPGAQMMAAAQGPYGNQYASGHLTGIGTLFGGGR